MTEPAEVNLRDSGTYAGQLSGGPGSASTGPTVPLRLTVLQNDADYRTVARHAPDLSEHNIGDVATLRSAGGISRCPGQEQAAMSEETEFEHRPWWQPPFPVS